jgi:hypothetical protein
VQDILGNAFKEKHGYLKVVAVAMAVAVTAVAAVVVIMLRHLEEFHSPSSIPVQFRN